MINPKKSVFLRMGPRCNTPCCDIVSMNGHTSEWVESLRYLGVYFVRSGILQATIIMLSHLFYRAFNSIFEKIGKFRSKETILQLINYKCMAYILEPRPINKTQEKWLKFTINKLTP